MKSEISFLKGKLEMVEKLNMKLQESLIQNNGKSSAADLCDRIGSSLVVIKNGMVPKLDGVSN